MSFESFEEFNEDLVSCFLSLEDIRVAISTVSVFDVLNVKVARLVLIYLVKSHLYKFHS